MSCSEVLSIRVNKSLMLYKERLKNIRTGTEPRKLAACVGLILTGFGVHVAYVIHLYILWSNQNKGKETKFVPVHAKKVRTGKAGMVSRILSLGIRWGEWSVSRPNRFTPRESARQPGYMRLGRPQRWYAYFGEETNFLSLPETETIFRTSSCVLTTTPTVQLDPSNGEAKNEWRQTSIPHTPLWCRPTHGQRYLFVYLSSRTEDAAALTQTTVTEYSTDPITYNTCRHNIHTYTAFLRSSLM